MDLKIKLIELFRISRNIQAFESELFDEDEKAFLNDEDFAQLSNMVDEETIDDEEYLESLLENDEVEI